MATRTLSPITAPPILRQLRIFRCHYLCDDCSIEWNDEMLVEGMSWCPRCDQETEPHRVNEFEEYRLEWEE